MIAVLFAVLAAASNALASVLQRRAARELPMSEAFRPTMMWDLIRRRTWLLGIGALILGFLLQAAALTFGGLALVQPLLVTELPFTMVLIAWMFHARLGPESWAAVIILSAGLAIFLVGAAPGGGRRVPDRFDWLLATVITIAVVGYLVSTAKLARGPARATLLGIASGLGFAFTATLMKDATRFLSGDAAELLVTWPLYAMVGAGLASVYLLQNALQSGTLVAVQPALNVSDPVASIAYGVALFDETIRLGGWVVPELLGIGMIFAGSVLLAQSPPIRRYTEVTDV
jgi:drug/metabolite transporter (DMT)-like permease